MNKYIFCFIIQLALIQPLKLNAQEFGALGTTWTYKAVDAFLQMSPDRIITLESIGLQFVGGVECNIIKKTSSSCDASVAELNYIYSSEGKVYWYNSLIQDFTILYDYNAEAGDSWSTEIEDCTIPVTVDTVKYEVFNGEMLKVLYLEPSNGLENSRIIEKIGNEKFVFPSIFSYNCNLICDGHLIEGGIRCYSDFEFSYQTINEEEEDCDQLTNQLDIVLESDIQIIPTVSHGDFQVLAKGTKIVNIEIVDLQGRTHSKYNNIESESQLLSIAKKGVYIVFIELSNKLRKVKKVIIK